MRILSFDIGTRNLAYCVLQVDGHDGASQNFTKNQPQLSITILQWERIDVFEQNNVNIDNANSYPINELYKLLHRSLFLRLYQWQQQKIQTILIEQQRENTRNIIVEGMVTMWLYVFLGKSIVHVSPTLKLKLNWNGCWLMNQKAVKKTECDPKKYTVEIVKSWLRSKFGFGRPEPIFFYRHKKKPDDLADSFLQAIAWTMQRSQTKQKKSKKTIT